MAETGPVRCVVCDAEAKYRCPGCDRRTCCLACVKKHKELFGCSGLKAIPSAPEAVETGGKYNEKLFVKDYNFLEAINTQISKLEEEKVEKRSGKAADTRDPVKLALFKKIQKASKLAELRMLPTGFSRSKQNRTHFIETAETAENTENETEIPVAKSSRMARIAWTIDFLDLDTCKVIETLFDIPDDTKLEDLLRRINCNKSVKAVYLRNETRLGRPTEKKREIGKEKWNRTIAQILIGGRCFEYPQFEISYESENENGKEDEKDVNKEIN